MLNTQTMKDLFGEQLPAASRAVLAQTAPSTETFPTDPNQGDVLLLCLCDSPEI